ncbi:methylenetetrahydrofolate reductase [NAD(P)H] [soil metagenome]|jgi:methylenetetrahydrofolate reductase (NADPH)
MQTYVRDLLAGEGPSFSFEFFPPKSDEGERVLWRAIRELRPLQPTFVDVTYGAGGSTRDRTLRVVERIARETDIPVVAHLTCTGTSVDEVRAVLRSLGEAGIRNILALRGDPPGGASSPWEAHEEGFHHAEELVRLVHEEGDFCVGVGAFPELHPESADRDTDIGFFARKVSAGADFAITQFFFDPADYFRLASDVRDRGCEVPIIPGIMPVTNLSSIERMAELSGAAFPTDLGERLRAVADDPAKVRAIGVEVATELCRELLDGGAPGIHFYTLNRSTATREIYTNLHPGHA